MPQFDGINSCRSQFGGSFFSLCMSLIWQCVFSPFPLIPIPFSLVFHSVSFFSLFLRFCFAVFFFFLFLFVALFGRNDVQSPRQLSIHLPQLYLLRTGGGFGCRSERFDDEVPGWKSSRSKRRIRHGQRVPGAERRTRRLVVRERSNADSEVKGRPSVTQHRK